MLLSEKFCKTGSTFVKTFLIFFGVFIFACSSNKIISDNSRGIESKKEITENKITEKKAMKALIETSMGNIEIELFEDKAPVTVANFVGLAEGTKEFTDLKTGKKTKKRFYDGLTFHRVIPDFMIQGGCPLGTGTGGPGYKFEDETKNGLKFNKPGLLAMANSGPNTNGSQFFITEVSTPWLDGNHTIFGQVAGIKDLEIIKEIARTECDMRDNPVEPVVINKITIVK
jgi:peptidyl-prolyl cis-trans isomerase A (cyclophilin A)